MPCLSHGDLRALRTQLKAQSLKANLVAVCSPLPYIWCLQANYPNATRSMGSSHHWCFRSGSSIVTTRHLEHVTCWMACSSSFCSRSRLAKMSGAHWNRDV